MSGAPGAEWFDTLVTSGAVYAGSFHGVFKSTDGGESFVAMRDGLLHQDVRALVVAGSPPRLWAGTAGGSLYSTELQ